MSQSERLDRDLGCLRGGEGPSAAEARPATIYRRHSPTSTWKLLSPLCPPTGEGARGAEGRPRPQQPPAGVFGVRPLASTGGEGGPWASALPDWLAARIGQGPPAVHIRRPDMAEAGKEPAGLALPGGGAAQWPLQRYGRFMPSGTGEPPGPGQDAGTASSPTWKVRLEGRKGREALNPPGGEGRPRPAATLGLVPRMPPRPEEGTPQD